MTFTTANFQRIWQTSVSPRSLVIFITIWVAVVLFSGIFHGDLSGYDDAAYAHEARAMLQSGDYWTLSLNGNPDFDKPPLFIWLLALSFKLFGATDVAAKLPGVILGWATVVLVYFLAKELFKNEPAEGSDHRWLPALSMLCMATTQYFLKYSSHAMTDVPFTFFFTLAIYFYVLALRKNIFLLAGGLATGLALMTRSPMGLFPVFIIVIDALFNRRLKLFLSPYFAGFVLIALAVPLTWYVREYRLFGDSFITGHFANFIAHAAATQARTSWQRFLWYFEYLFLIPKLYLPWFPLLFYGVFLVLKKARFQPIPVGAFLLTWALMVLIPFSFAESKVFRYILPAFPAFAMISAFALYSLLSPRFLTRFSFSAVTLLLPIAMFTIFIPNFRNRAEDMHSIGPISDAATSPGEKVVLYTSGEYQWNYLNQLLWYGNRNCIQLRDMNEIESLRWQEKNLVVVMDKPSFDDLKSRGANIVILGESEGFYCFRFAE